MGLDIVLDPIGTLDAVFDFSGNQARADQQIAYSEEQRLLDNQYRARQERSYEQNLARERQRQDEYLQRLAVDAQKAGISLLSALGNPGATPMSLGMPSGQGGRVAGTYKRTPLPAMKAAYSVGQKYDEADRYHGARLTQNQADYWYWKSKQVEGNFNSSFGNDPDPKGEYPSLYIKAIDNSEEAMKWYEDGYWPANNPMLNLEYPESIGGYYYAKPRLGSPSSEQPKLPYWGP